MQRRSISKKCFIFSLLSIISLATVSRANIYPPTATSHFYGDADGDLTITNLDIGQHSNILLGRSTTYDTLQPATPQQEWNTCDLDGDRACSNLDIGQLRNIILGKPVAIGDLPWVLVNVNLPTTGNAPEVWIPFNISLYSTDESLGASGRPGISVMAEIDPSSAGTGQLAGRTCSPVPDTRDQAASAGAQCAIAVTVTDWDTQPTQGLTQSGTYGFSIWNNGDGDLIINFIVTANVTLDIPAVTLSIPIQFTPSPTVWYVDDSATGANNGTSWADAFNSPQDAVNAASAGEVVWVAQGTYAGSSTGPVVTMKDGVSMYGGFVGTESFLSERPDPSLNPSVLDGVNGQAQMTSNITIFGASNATFDGFTVTGGGIFSEWGGFGAGMSNSSVSNLTIANCDFSGNMATGMDNTNSSITVTNSSFGNQTCQGSSGMYNGNSNVLIENSLFSGNSDSGAGCFGNCSALGSFSGSATTVVNSLFTNNYTEGGYVICSGGTDTFLNCTIYNNSGLSGMGGMSANTSTTLINTILRFNFTYQLWISWDQEGFFDLEGPATLINSTTGLLSSPGLSGSLAFVTNFDPHPQIDSPCVDGGTMAGAPPDDYDGAFRPSGQSADVGAYEYQFQCSDNQDNDGDTQTDFPNDAQCYDSNDPTESVVDLPQCQDTTDNDGDTLTDYPADLQCSSTEDWRESSAGTCGNGVCDVNEDKFCPDCGCAAIGFRTGVAPAGCACGQLETCWFAPPGICCPDNP